MAPTIPKNVSIVAFFISVRYIVLKISLAPNPFLHCLSSYYQIKFWYFSFTPFGRMKELYHFYIHNQKRIKMKSQNKQSTAKMQTPEQKLGESYKAILIDLNNKVLRSEITDITAEAKLGSRNTTVSYLLGKVKKHAIAQRVIVAARKVISRRNRAIAA